MAPEHALAALAPEWEVRREHADDPRARFVGHAAALLGGRVLTPQQLDELTGFLSFTAYADVVVDYDSIEGFAFRRRDPALDAPRALVRRTASA
ncbi:MAG: hypothetical protein ACTHMS_03070 [Jatrophihabitans sp.]|uniref:hypothetical protein n=1 Tax=Jatrophihabitans sp. TaxID=1932789 RepID=UPI003F7F8696